MSCGVALSVILLTAFPSWGRVTSLGFVVATTVEQELDTCLSELAAFQDASALAVSAIPPNSSVEIVCVPYNAHFRELVHTEEWYQELAWNASNWMAPNENQEYSFNISESEWCVLLYHHFSIASVHTLFFFVGVL